MKDFDNKPDSGVLFAQLSKKTEKTPDYTGSLSIDLNNLDAVENKDGILTIKLSGWKKKSRQGTTFLSLAVNRFVPNPKFREGATPSRSYPSKDDIDNLPF